MSEERNRFLRTRTTDAYELQCECWVTVNVSVVDALKLSVHTWKWETTQKFDHFNFSNY